MKQAELQHYRAILQQQMDEAPAKRRLFAAPSGPAIVRLESAPAPRAAGPIPPARASLFGRRRRDPAGSVCAQDDGVAGEPLLLDMGAVAPATPTPRLRLHTPVAAGHFSETPFHAEDLADPAPNGPAPGFIAGWSTAKPPSAQLRLLRRLCAVVEAERVGLGARLAAAGVEAA